MSLRAFKTGGHPATLLSAFLYFDVSFMVWVILGPLGPFIGEALKLSATEKGFLTAVPLLGGSLCRPMLGWSTERFGGRKTGLFGLGITLAPLLMGWQFAHTFHAFLAMGLLLGIAGASFAVALPLASAWYAPEHQGLAMGIAGAGNSGTLLATLFAPRLAHAWGWHNVFALATLPVIAVWLLFFALAEDAPVPRRQKTFSDYAGLLKAGDSGWFCFLYCLTFGGFSGLTSYLSIFFHDQYHLTGIEAGDFTTFVVVFGSFLRPIGGMLSDRIGGYRILLAVLAGAAISIGCVASLPAPSIALGLLAFCMAMLGMGNGSIFQLVPQRFPDQVGIMTGIVGAAGGFGGFLLPSFYGAMKDVTGSFAPGFLAFSVCLFCGAATLRALKSTWKRTWPRAGAARAGLLDISTAEKSPAMAYASRS